MMSGMDNLNNSDDLKRYRSTFYFDKHASDLLHELCRREKLVDRHASMSRLVARLLLQEGERVANAEAV